MSRPVLPPSFPATRRVDDAPVPEVGARRRRFDETLGGSRRRAAALRAWLSPVGRTRWASGLFAGVQGAVLSLLVVVVPAVAAYVATSADPANDAIGWPRAVAVGAALWLLGQGGALVAGDATVALVPLGITALVIFGCYASARRSAHPTVGAWLAAVGGHLAVVAVVLLGAGPTGPLGAGSGAVTRTLLGSLAVAALGLGLGAARPGMLATWAAPRLAVVPAWVRTSVRVGLAVPAALVAVAAAVTATWAVAGRAATGDVLAALGPDAFGGATLAVAQLALVPNLVLWALSWLTGTGFAVGAGTRFAPDEILGGPMPALPMLGALPTDAGGVLAWAPAVVVLAGLLAAWWLHRRLAEQTAWQPLAAVGVTAAVAATVTGLLALVSGGPVGPGRMTVVGPSAVLVALDTAALLVPALVLVLPGSALVRQAVRRALRRGSAEDPAGQGDGVGVSTSPGN